jgi:decaprenyl-phosphate phosphoribosyltransferase
VTAVPLLVASPGLLTAMRPRQWVKNVLVVAPLLPAARALDADALAGAGVAFLVFCAASSAVYLVNDVCDRDVDRAHPVKCARPIACGVVTPASALSAAVVLLLLAVALALSRGPELLLVLLVYLGIQAAYCLRLKHEPVLELASVTSGFLLRAIAGGVAAGIVLSDWFLLSAAFGSLFVAAGKRYAEALTGERTGGQVRPVVARYSVTYLRFVWTLAATVVVSTYAQWAFEVRAETGSPWSVLSCVPFVLAVLRYGAVVDEGRGEQPEVVVLGDPVLLSLGGLWCGTLLLAVS